MLTDGGDHADVASTIAFSLAKELRKAPAIIAQEIAGAISDQVMAETGAETRAVGPYVNFIFGAEYCMNVLEQAVREGYGKGQEKPRGGSGAPICKPEGLVACGRSEPCETANSLTCR